MSTRPTTANQATVRATIMLLSFLSWGLAPWSFGRLCARSPNRARAKWSSASAKRSGAANQQVGGKAPSVARVKCSEQCLHVGQVTSLAVSPTKLAAGVGFAPTSRRLGEFRGAEFLVGLKYCERSPGRGTFTLIG